MSMNVRFYFSHDIKITLKSHFDVKTSIFCHLLCNVLMDVITLRNLIFKPLVVYGFYCMAFYHSHAAMSCDN